MRTLVSSWPVLLCPIAIVLALACDPGLEPAGAKEEAMPPTEKAAPSPAGAKADEAKTTEAKAESDTAQPDISPSEAIAAREPAVPEPATGIRIHPELADDSITLDSGESCTPMMVGAVGLPAVRGDGKQIVFLTIEGPANGDDLSFEYALVFVDRAGTVEDTVPLWSPRDLEELAGASTCSARNEVVSKRAAAAGKRVSTGAWRTMDVLPPHVDLVRDLEGSESACEGWVPPSSVSPAPGGRAPVLSCGNRPRTLEVALVAGPTVALRVPGVKVWHKQAAKDLRVPIIDTWEPGLCSGAPVLEAAWRDPATNLVLMQVNGSDYMMDACGYRQVYRVLELPALDLPELPWTRSPSPVDVMLAGEELELP